MDVDQIAEIVTSSTCEIFSAMLGTELTVGSPYEDPHPFGSSTEVTAFIGLAGGLAGYVSLHCELAQAREFTARLLGSTSDDSISTDEICDAVGELVNMIAGGVKTALSGEHPVEITLPTVVMTPKPDMRVKSGKGVVVPFEDPSGSFLVELTLEESKTSG